MHIVHLAAELSPLAKVGGLGEAVHGLLHSLGPKQDSLVLLPYYGGIKANPSFKHEMDLKVFIESKTFSFQFFKGKVDNFSVVLVKNASFFQRKNIYGYNDDVERFLAFCTASISYLEVKKKPIDILHLHDWHTAASLCYLNGTCKGLKVKKTVLSIHNLCYQGITSKKTLLSFGITHCLPQLKNETGNVYNLLKAGIILADRIVAVSPTYSREILQKKNSFNLYSTLNKHKKKIVGILNGIDTNVWNPRIDPHLQTSYGANKSIEALLKAKKRNKEALYKQLSLSFSSLPLVVYIGRLTEQKGLELIEEAIEKAKKGLYTFVLLGSSTEPEIQKRFLKLKTQLKNEKTISLNFGFDEALAHQIYASADFILVPSKFEPCGLIQLIAFHYATLPIVRKTGGLADTVTDKNGYLFTKYSNRAFNRALNKALKQYNTKKHQEKVLQAFSENFCWSFRIRDYLKLYHDLIKEEA